MENRKVFRPGKTERDRRSGAHDRSVSNKQERASWQNDTKRDMKSFPWHTCNGKRNRFHKH